jgi:hypothetical protein
MFRKESDIDPATLDNKIREFLNTRTMLDFWVKRMTQTYRNILLSPPNNFTDKQMANVKNMMDEIFRYAKEISNISQDENNDSCNITTVK